MLYRFLSVENWANPERGFFWLSTSTLWCDPPFINHEKSLLSRLIELFTVVKLDKPMRNSGKILRYVDHYLNHDASWEITDYNVDSLCLPEGIAPTVFEVNGNMRNNLHAYINIFEDALLEMRAYSDFNREVEKRQPFVENIVVFIPSSFRISDVDVLEEVANKLGFNTGRYFVDVVHCSDKNLKSKHGVLFTDKFLYQGCESKLLINFEDPFKDYEKKDRYVRMDKSDATLRCTTKVIVIKIVEDTNLDLDWSILMRFTPIISVLITLMPWLQTSICLLSIFFLLFSFNEQLQSPLLASFFSKSSWLSFSMSLAIGNLLSEFPSLSVLFYFGLFFICYFFIFFMISFFFKKLIVWKFPPYSDRSSITESPVSFSIWLTTLAVAFLPFVYLCHNFLSISLNKGCFQSDYLSSFLPLTLTLAFMKILQLCFHFKSLSYIFLALLFSHDIVLLLFFINVVTKILYHLFSTTRASSSFSVGLFKRSATLQSNLQKSLYHSHIFLYICLYQFSQSPDLLFSALASISVLCLCLYFPFWQSSERARDIVIFFLTLASACLSLSILDIFSDGQFSSLSFFCSKLGYLKPYM